MMTILVIHMLPSPDGDCLQFNSPVARIGDQSYSVVEEVLAFNGALLAGVHRPMQTQWRTFCCWGTFCRTVAPLTFVPPVATRHADVNVARSSHCCGASLHSSPCFSSSHYVASHFIISVSPHPPLSWSFLSWWSLSPPSSGCLMPCHKSETSLLGGYSSTRQPERPHDDVASSFQIGQGQGLYVAVGG
jgi:hypothetical protein